MLRKYAQFIFHAGPGDQQVDPERQELKHLRQLLRSVEEQLHAAQCRIKQYPESCHVFLSEQISLYQAQINAILKQMEKIIDHDPGLKQQAELMQSVPGVGRKSAALLLAELPELGKMNKKQIAALLGLAPKTSQSGQKIHRSRIQGGRFYARKVMYMCALVASRHDPKMRELYKRLVALGKAKKVALVAIMRKMIVCLNAMLKNNTTFKPLYS